MNKHIFKEMQRRMDEMKATTIVDPESMADVVQEATMHLVEHFRPGKKSPQDEDYVFIMGSAFLGYEVCDSESRVHPFTFYAMGDLHNWAHQLADTMLRDPQVARSVFHAMEVYNAGGSTRTKKNF